MSSTTTNSRVVSTGFFFLLFMAASATAFVVKEPTTAKVGFQQSKTVLFSGFNTAGMWKSGLNFGKPPFNFYRGFDDFLSPFPEEDRKEFPEVFNLPKGLYEVDLDKPLGIVFEEIDIGKGLYVQDMVEGGNAERSGKVMVGDILVGITAVKIVGAKYERRMIPCRKFDFDTMVGAVESNDAKWGCDGVILMLERPEEADSAEIDNFMEFFEPPVDNPWKQRQ